MPSTRARLAVTAVVLLLISLVISVSLTHQSSGSHAGLWAAGYWASQAAFWLGIVSAAGALASWLVEEIRLTGS